MSTYSGTVSELKRTVARFDLLLNAPDVTMIDTTPDQSICSICQELFQERSENVEEVVDRPVRLTCGHTFGLKCKLHPGKESMPRQTWGLWDCSSELTFRTTLSGAMLISDGYEHVPGKRSLEITRAVMTTLTHLTYSPEVSLKQECLDWLRDALRDWMFVEGEDVNRILILGEEFIDYFCRPEAYGTNLYNRAVAAEQQSLELRRLLAEMWSRQARLNEFLDSLSRETENLRETQKEVDAMREEVAAIHAELTTCEQELAACRDGSQQARAELRESRNSEKDLKRQLAAAIDSLQQTQVDLKWARSAIVPASGSILSEVLTAVLVIYVWTFLFTRSRIMVKITANVILGLFGLLALLVVSRGVPWRVAFLRGTVPVVLIALALFDVNSM
ncbi:hypothetical protein ACLMJK_001952 [Lecanora helva]